jgi:Calcineurin-like phosphoesterase
MSTGRRSTQRVSHVKGVGRTKVAGLSIIVLTFGLAAAPLTPAAHSMVAAVNAAGSPVVLAVGDMACDPQDPKFNGGAGSATRCAERRVSDQMVAQSGYDAVLGLGDYQYACGGAADWRTSYDPTYGRLDPWMDPIVGNHEYKTGTDYYGDQCPTSNTTASTYFSHFAQNDGSNAAHPKSGGHYSLNLGSWHLVGLNAQCAEVNSGGCSATSAQTTWLRQDLAANTQPCILAYWHQPRWTDDGDGNAYSTWWNVLYNYHADVVLNGHVHNYQRYPALNPNGNVDRTKGITQFIVGTGGEAADQISAAIPPNPSPVAAAEAFGYLRMNLKPTGWTARFINDTGTVLDTSTGTCHG